MSETVSALNERAEDICVFLGTQGMKHVEVRRYRSNELMVSSVTATGDCGDGLVSVTAIREGRNTTYMMHGPDPEEGGTVHTMGADVMRGVYRDLGHELLWFLDERPDEGAYDLPIKHPTEFDLPQSVQGNLPFAA